MNNQFLHTFTKDKFNEEINNMEQKIYNELYGYGGFYGFDLFEQNDEVTIRGFHRDVPQYAYTAAIKFSSDFSDCEQATDRFIKLWKQIDNEQYVKQYKECVKLGGGLW